MPHGAYRGQLPRRGRALDCLLARGAVHPPHESRAWLFVTTPGQANLASVLPEDDNIASPIRFDVDRGCELRTRRITGRDANAIGDSPVRYPDDASIFVADLRDAIPQGGSATIRMYQTATDAKKMPSSGWRASPEGSRGDRITARGCVGCPAEDPGMIAERMHHIAPSATLKVGIEANALRRQGADLVDFGQGEPDFPTPEHIKAAARAAIDADFTRYTPAAGVLELRQALCSHYERLYSTRFEPSQTLVAAGGKQALFNVMLALVNPGDEIVTHTPGWPSIPEQVRLMGGTPVLVECRTEDGFAIHAEPILDAVTPKTKAIVINSPCNPTGALITEEALAAIGDAAAQRGIWVVADLCYEQIVYESVPHNVPKVLMSRLSNRAVLTGSCSKSYAMTGWRCGWAIGPAPLIHACEVIQGHSTSNVTSVTQKAAIAALSGSQEPTRAMIREYRRRRDAAHELFTVDPRVRCSEPGGAFYLFLDVRQLLGFAGISSSSALADALLHEAHLVVTAGEAFDAPGYIRISYATSVDRIQEGAKRFHGFLERLSARDRIR